MAELIQPGFEDENGVVTPTHIIDDVQDPVASGKNLARALMNIGSDPVRYAGRDIYSQVSNKVSPKKFEGMSTSESYNPNEWLAASQSNADKWGNALAKMAITGTTTFLDGTIGTIYGTLEALSGGSFVNNEFSQALAGLNRWSEEVLPNFYTQKELESPWYTQLGTANFWADKFVKNFGFTIGAVYSGMAWSGATKALLGSKKIARNVAKGIITNIAEDSKHAASAAKNLNAGKIGKAMRDMKHGKIISQLPEQLAKDAKRLSSHNYIMQFVGGVSGAQGESRIEAINNAMDFEEGQLAQIEKDISSRLPEFEREGKVRGLDGQELLDYVDSKYNEELSKEEARLKPYVEGFRNANFLMDFVVLSLGNIAQFRNAFSGGYALERGMLNSAKKYVGEGEAVEGLKGVAKSVYKGPKGFLKNSQDILSNAGRIVKNGMWEAFEEFSQDVVEQTGIDYYGSKFDPEATDNVNGYFRTLFSNYMQYATSPEEWESAFIGFLTGMLGVPVVSRGGKGGVSFEMTGGLWEGVREARESKKFAEQMVDRWNQMVESEDFKNLYLQRVSSEAFANDAQAALEAQDIFRFENAKNGKFIVDIITAIDTGMYQDLLDFYDSLAQQDPELVRDAVRLVKDTEGKEIAPDKRTGMFDNMTDSEIRSFLTERGRQLRENAEYIRDIYEALEIKLPNTSDKFVREQITYYATSARNIEQRVNNILNELRKHSGNSKQATTLYSQVEEFMDIHSQMMEYIMNEIEVEYTKKEQGVEDRSKDKTESKEDSEGTEMYRVKGDSKKTKARIKKGKEKEKEPKSFAEEVFKANVKHLNSERALELKKRREEIAKAMNNTLKAYTAVLGLDRTNDLIEQINSLPELVERSTKLTLIYQKAMEEGGPETIRKYFGAHAEKVQAFNEIVTDSDMGDTIAEVSSIESEEFRGIATEALIHHKWTPVEGTEGERRYGGTVSVRMRGLNPEVLERNKKENPDASVEELRSMSETETTEEFAVLGVTNEGKGLALLSKDGYRVDFIISEDGTIANSTIYHGQYGEYLVSDMTVVENAQKAFDDAVRRSIHTTYTKQIKAQQNRIKNLNFRLDSVNNVTDIVQKLFEGALHGKGRVRADFTKLNSLEQEYLAKAFRGLTEADIKQSAFIVGLDALETALSRLDELTTAIPEVVNRLEEIRESLKTTLDSRKEFAKNLKDRDYLFEKLEDVIVGEVDRLKNIELSELQRELQNKRRRLQILKDSVRDFESQFKDRGVKNILKKIRKKLPTNPSFRDMVDTVRDASTLMRENSIEIKLTQEQIEELEKQIKDLEKLYGDSKKLTGEYDKTFKNIQRELSKHYSWKDNINPFLEEVKTPEEVEKEKAKVEKEKAEAKRQQEESAIPTPPKTSTTKESTREDTKEEVSTKQPTITRGDVEGMEESTYKEPLHRFIGVTEDFAGTSINQLEYIKEVEIGNYTHEPELLFSEFSYNYKLVPKGHENYKYLTGISIKNFLQKYGDELIEDVRKGLEKDLETYPNAILAVVTNEDGSFYKLDRIKTEKGKSLVYAKINDGNSTVRESGYDKFSIGRYQIENKLTHEQVSNKVTEIQQNYKLKYIQPILSAEDGIRMEITQVSPGKIQWGENRQSILTAFNLKTLSADQIHVAQSSIFKGNITAPGLVYFNVDGKIIRGYRERLDEGDVTRVVNLFRALALQPEDNSHIWQAIKDIIYTGKEGTYSVYPVWKGPRGKRYLESIRYGEKTKDREAIVYITREELMDTKEGNHRLEKFERFLASKYYQVNNDNIGKSFILHNAEIVTNEDGVVTEATMVEDKIFEGGDGYINYLLEGVGEIKGKVTTEIKTKEITREQRWKKPNIVNQSVKFEIVKSEYEDRGVKATPSGDSRILRPADASEVSKLNREALGEVDIPTVDSHIDSAIEEPSHPSMAEAIRKHTKAKQEEQNEVFEDKKNAFETAIEEKEPKLNIPKFRISRETDTQISYTQELQKFREVLPDIGVEVVSKNLSNVEGVFQSTKESARILVSTTMGEGTLFHEAFHAVSQLFTTVEERQQLYDSVRKALGNTVVEVQEGGKSTNLIEVKGRDMTDAQAEEYLAEEFKDFMLVGKDAYKFGENTTKKNVFQRLWDFIKRLLLPKSMWMKSTDIILSKFDEISNSSYSIQDRINFESVELSRVGNLSEATAQKMLGNINYMFFEILEHNKQNLLEGYNTLDKIASDIYDAVYVAAIEKGREGNESFMDMVINWDGLINRHIDYLKQFNMTIDKTQFLNGIIEEGLEFELTRRNDNWAESNIIDVRETIPSALKLLIAGLPNEIMVSNKSIKDLHAGMPMATMYNQTLMSLLKGMANLNTIEEMVAKMIQMTSYNPMIGTLMERLGITSDGSLFAPNITKEQASLQTIFFNTFHKSNVDYITAAIKEHGTNIYLISNESENNNRKIRDEWRENARYKVGRISGLLTQKGDDIIIGKSTNVSLMTGHTGVKLSDINTVIIEELIKDKGSHLSEDGKANLRLDIYRYTLSLLGINVPALKHHIDILGEAIDWIFGNMSKHKGELTIEQLYDTEGLKVNKELKALVEIVAEVSPHVGGLQIHTGANTEYSIMDNTRLGKVLNELLAGDKSHLFSPWNEHSLGGNYATYGSVWQHEIVNRKRQVEEVIIRNLGTETGDKTDISQASHSDYIRALINNTLEGIFPYLRSAERKVERAFNFGKDYMDYEMAKNKTRRARALESYVMADMLELVALINTPEAVQLTQRNRHKSLGIFRDIIPQEITDLILAQEGKLSPENYLSFIRDTFFTESSPYYQDIQESLKQFVKESDERTFAHWEENGIILKNPRSNTYALLGVNTEKIKSILGHSAKGKVDFKALSEKDLSTIISVYNHYTHQSFIEQTKLITGNPIAYQSPDGSTSFFKRTTMFASTIGGSMVNPQFHEWLDTNSPRLDGRRRVADNGIRREVTHLDKIESLGEDMLEAYLNIVGENNRELAEIAYTKMNTNDAFGMATLDGFRDLVMRTAPHEWTKEVEKAWQYSSQAFAQAIMKLEQDSNLGLTNTWTRERFENTFKEHLPENWEMGKYYYEGAELNYDYVTFQEEMGYVLPELDWYFDGNVEDISIEDVRKDYESTKKKGGNVQDMLNSEKYKKFLGNLMNEGREQFQKTLNAVISDYFGIEYLSDRRIGHIGTRKTQGTGRIMNVDLQSLNAIDATKHATSMINPLDFLDNSDVLIFLHNAMELGIDFFNPESAKKAERIGNDKGEIHRLSTEEGLSVEGAPITEVSWKDIGDQMYIQQEEGRRRVTMSSQMNRVVFMNAFERAEGINKIKDTHKDLAEVYEQKHRLQQTIIEKNFENFLKKTGLEVGESTQDAYKLLDSKKFFDTLIDTFKRRHSPMNITDAIKAVMNANNKVFDAMPSKIQVINALHGLLRNDVVSLKTHGEMLVQVSPFLWENSGVESSRDFKLGGYVPRDAEGNLAKTVETMESLDPMEIMVRLPQKLIPYVQQYFEGNTFEEKLSNFNEKIHDSKWLEANPDAKEILQVIGVRIPTAGLNTVEAMKIKRFLHPSNGAVVVVSGSLVAKSGADFDIDKLTSHFANFSIKKGQIIYERLKDEKNLHNNTISALENAMNEATRKILLHKHSARDMLNPDNSAIISEQANVVKQIIAERNLEVHESSREDIPSDSAPVHYLIEGWYSSNIGKHQWGAMEMVPRGAINGVSHVMTQVAPIRVDSDVFRIAFKDFDAKGEELYMGHEYDSESNRISDTNRAVLSGSLDSSNEVFPSIFIINLNRRTANAYFMLNRVGSESQAPVGFKFLTKFFTAPIISQFLRQSEVNESVYLQNLRIKDQDGNNVKASKSKYHIVRELTGQSEEYKFLYEYAADYIKSTVENRAETKAKLVQALDHFESEYGKIAEEDFSSTNRNRQRAVLEYFLYCQEMGKLLGQLHTSTRPDAGITKDTNTLKLRQRKLQRMKDLGFFNTEDINSFFENTFVGAYQNIHGEALKVYKDFFMLEKHSTLENFLWGEDGLITMYENPELAIPEEKLTDITFKLQNAFMTFLLQNADFNGKPVHDRIDDLFITPGNTLADRLIEVKRIEPDNIALRELTAVHREVDKKTLRALNMDYIKLFNRRMSTEESNAFTESIRELLGHPDLKVKEFAQDLIIGSILQSGVQRSPISFFELLPANVYHGVLSHLIEGIEMNHGAKVFKPDLVRRNIMANLYRDASIFHRQYVKEKNIRKAMGRRRISLSNTSGGYNYDYVSVSIKTGKKHLDGRDVDELIPFELRHRDKNQATYIEMDRMGEGMRLYDGRSMETAVERKITMDMSEATLKQDTPIEATPVDSIEDFTLHSGGAIGADTAWGVIGSEYGLKNLNHYYHGEKTPKGNLHISDVDYNEGRIEAAKAAKRNFGYSYNTMKDSRLIRNWSQVKHADAVYAIGTIVNKGELLFPSIKGDKRTALEQTVAGGTGYAVAMAKNHNKPIYVFNQKEGTWYTWDYGSESFIETETPILTKNFAGIGSRNIGEVAKQAIRNVYEKTLSGRMVENNPVKQLESQPTKPTVEEYKGRWTREEVSKQTDKVFLFGDNTMDRVVTKHIPTTTQAVIRGLPNAIGIDTKLDRGTTEKSYMTNAHFDRFKNQVDIAIQQAKDSGKTIVLPADGIGTGKAELAKRAPKLFEYLQNELNKLKGEEVIDSRPLTEKVKDNHNDC